MKAWILYLALAVGVLVLLYFTKRNEGFEDFLQLNNRFTRSQDKYFEDQAGKEIYVNPGLKLDMTDAVYQPDLYLATSKDRSYKDYLAENPYNAYMTQDTMCRQARSPKDLPARAARDIVGCGWWFHPDVPSVGAVGVLSGPIISEKLPVGGQWIWDVPTAVMKEDVKFCKRIKNCDLISVPGIAGRCGFCTRLGHAVPIQSDGSDKYPDSTDGACGAPTKRTPDECRPPPPPLVTREGIKCKTYGRPSPDNRIRLYNKDECDALNGKWYPNGECLIKTGGSYSAACSGLNSPLQAVSPRTCDPGPSGALSKECLISLASGIGFTKAGAILKNMYNNVKPSGIDQQAIDMLATIGISIPAAVLGSGQIDLQTAGTTYQKIYNAMTSASKPMVQEAAKWLAVGSDNFDVCNLDAKAAGPFNPTCLQQAFREAGCQASGAAYPSKATAAKYASMTWGDVATFFKNTYASMSSSDVATQDKATKECLGVSYYRPPPAPAAPKQYPGYTTYPDSDRPTEYMACYSDGRDASDCKARCDADPNCKAFNEVLKYGPWGGQSGCCTKRTANPIVAIPKVPGNGTVHFYKKDPMTYAGYTTTANSDRGGADIACYTDGRSADSCKKECDGNEECLAFNDVDVPGWGAGKGCCLKTEATPVGPFPKNVGDVHFYAKQNVVPPTTVCGVNRNDEIYCADRNIESNPNWYNVPGRLSNVSVSNGKLGGANSSDQIWFADNGRAASWVNAWGALVQVSQDKGIVVGVNRGGNMYYADNGNKAQPNWVMLPPGPGPAANMCISEGHLWHANTGHGLMYADNYKSPRWQEVKIGTGPGAVRQVSADKGVVCLVSGGYGVNERQVWCYDNGNALAPNWTRIQAPLMLWVSIKNGKIYAVDTANNIYFKKDYKDKTNNWVQIPGSLKQVDMDKN
jgi:hypothetical protein